VSHNHVLYPSAPIPVHTHSYETPRHGLCPCETAVVVAHLDQHGPAALSAVLSACLPILVLNLRTRA
jgi:hypothetical protein